MSNSIPDKKQGHSLEVGHWVALTLEPGAAPLRSYVGLVKAIDDRGVRLTLVDWLTGGPHGHDFFAPWDVITSALVATPDDDMDLYTESAKQWQNDMNHGRGDDDGDE